jgi:hypothetical protein
MNQEKPGKIGLVEISLIFLLFKIVAIFKRLPSGVLVQEKGWTKFFII